MPQRRKVVERKVAARLKLQSFTDLSKQLCLLDAVDAQIAFQVGIQFHHLRRIAGLFDDKVDQDIHPLFLTAGGKRGWDWSWWRCRGWCRGRCGQSGWRRGDIDGARAKPRLGEYDLR